MNLEELAAAHLIAAMPPEARLALAETVANSTPETLVTDGYRIFTMDRLAFEHTGFAATTNDEKRSYAEGWQLACTDLAFGGVTVCADQVATKDVLR